MEGWATVIGLMPFGWMLPCKAAAVAAVAAVADVSSRAARHHRPRLLPASRSQLPSGSTCYRQVNIRTTANCTCLQTPPPLLQLSCVEPQQCAYAPSRQMRNRMKG